MATHSNIHAWRILWTEEPGELQSIRSQESQIMTDLNAHKKSIIILTCNHNFKNY